VTPGPLLRQALGSLLVAVLGAVLGWVVTAAVLPYGAPTDAVAVLGLTVTVLGVALGCTLLARRLPVDEPASWGAALVGPVLLALLMGLSSQAPWWFRLVTVVALLGGAVAGLRSGTRDSDQPPARVRLERGSGSLELVGVVVLAAVLVAALVGAVGARDPEIRDSIWAAICKVTGGDCSVSAAPSNVDFKPGECELYSGENRVNATVDVTFVRLGGGGMVQRSEKSNGDIEITMLYEGRGGVVASAGGKGTVTVGESTFGAGWQAEAAATGGYQSGETYVFTDSGQADDFQRYLQRELAEDSVFALNPVAGFVNKGVEWATNEQPPANHGVQKTYVRYDGTVEGSISGSLGYGASAKGEASAMVALGTELDRGKDAGDPSDDTATDFYQVDWSAGLDVGLPMVKGISGSHSPSGVVKVTRDAAGEPVSVTIVDRAQGGFQIGLNAHQDSVSGIDPNAPESALAGWGLKFTGGSDSSTVVTQTLDLDSPERRAAFDDWFSWSTGIDTAGKASLPNGMVDTTQGEAVAQYGGSAEEFTEMLAQGAKVSIVEYDGTTWGLGANVEAGLGIKGGFDVGYTDSESRSVKAAYLGAPGADGSRASYDLPECVS
jgi:hypothetical protein